MDEKNLEKLSKSELVKLILKQQKLADDTTAPRKSVQQYEAPIPAPRT